MNKILKSRTYHLFFKKEDRLLSCDSYELDNRLVILKSLPDKMQDKDYAMEYYIEGWPKDANEKIGFLYSNSLIPSTKDYHFLNEKKHKFYIDSLNECLVQLKKKY